MWRVPVHAFSLRDQAAGKIPVPVQRGRVFDSLSRQERRAAPQYQLTLDGVLTGRTSHQLGHQGREQLLEMAAGLLVVSLSEVVLEVLQRQVILIVQCGIPWWEVSRRVLPYLLDEVQDIVVPYCVWPDR